MGRLMSLADMVQQNRLRAQQIQRQNALTGVFADPNALDDQGNVTPNTLKRVMALDPKFGMELRSDMLTEQVKKLQAQSYQSDIGKSRFDFMSGAAGSAVDAYDAAKKAGKNEQDAISAGTQARNEAVAANGGILSEEAANKITSTPFVPDQARAFANANEKWKTGKRADKADARADDSDKRAAAREGREADAYDREKKGVPLDEEGITEAARTYISRGTLPPGANPEQVAKIATKAGQLRSQGYAGPKELGSPTEIQYKDADGKTHQVLAQQDKTGGGWVTADENRTPIKGSEIRIINKDTPLPGDESVEGQARLIAEYRQAPLSNFAQGKPFGSAVMARVREINPNYDATQYETRKKAARDFGTGKQGDTARSLNVAVSHLDTLDELAQALNNKDVKVINRLKNELGSQFGKVAPDNFNFARQIVADEVMKAVIGSGAGGVEERRSLQESFNSAKSYDQLAGAIRTAEALMGGQLGGLRQQYQRTTGHKDFDEQFLSERTAKVLERSEPNQRPGEPGVAGAVPGQFVEGRVYRDKDGNKAKYVKGQWVPVNE